MPWDLTASDEPRARGKDPRDVTSFLGSQRSWSLNNRPAILWQYKKADHKNPDYEPQARTDPVTGEVVRDPRTGRPLRLFRNIPTTLSTKVEGWYLEAIMREDDRITLKDVFAYLPNVPDKPKDEHALQMRTKRFREEYRLRSWCDRAGTTWWEAQIEADLTEEQRVRNTTWGLARYSADELKAIRQGRQGTCPQRAGGRTKRKKAETEEDGTEGSPAQAKRQRRRKNERGPAAAENGQHGVVNLENGGNESLAIQGRSEVCKYESHMIRQD